jgi:hypothetical protein
MKQKTSLQADFLYAKVSFTLKGISIVIAIQEVIVKNLSLLQ